MKKEYSIEIQHFMFNMSTDGISSGIVQYRKYMSEFTTVENDMYIFNLVKLRKYGFDIPTTVKKNKFKIVQLDDFAYSCIQMGIDAFSEILNKICKI
jgi:hypothetical protein